MVLKRDIVLDGVVSGVEIIGNSWEFGRDGVNLFNEGSDATFLTQLTNSEFRAANASSDLFVGEAHLF